MELLAPAGTPESALAAFDYGADAVYLGLQKFSARERARNFNLDTLDRLLEYRKKVGKRVYLTINTLLKEAEIVEVAEILHSLSSNPPDALIVQDLGLVHLVREYFPYIPLHASTQMGIHNSAGLKFAERLGIQRVILERQVTLSELELMVPKTKVELEVFVHGALCCCLSGKCLLSSWNGGNSGNRGRCKQPCRRSFETDNGAEGFFLSMADLCSLENVGKLAQLGIASLKIEGRMQGPDVVSCLVEAYRMVIDHPGDADILYQANQILNRTPSRRLSGGFWSSDNFENLIDADQPGASGRFIGTVSRVLRGGFLLSAEGRLHIGDRIRVQTTEGDDGSQFTVIKMLKNDEPVKFVQRGETCFIGTEKPIPFDGIVYHTGISRSAAYENRIEQLPASRKQFDLKIIITASGCEVTVSNAKLQNRWQYACNFSPAERNPLTVESVTTLFQASASDQIQAGKIDVQIEGSWFLPASMGKQMRREFWLWAGEQMLQSALELTTPSGYERFLAEYATRKNVLNYEGKTGFEYRGETDKPLPSHARKVVDLCEDSTPENVLILPFFCRETDLENVQSVLARKRAQGHKRFRLTDIYQISLFADWSDAILHTSFPLPVTNSLAAQMISKFHITQVQAWIELDQPALHDFIAKCPLPLEIFRYGHPVLLATRAIVEAEDTLEEKQREHYQIEYDESADLTLIRSQRPMEHPAVIGCAEYFEGFPDTNNRQTASTFNLYRSWL